MEQEEDSQKQSVFVDQLSSEYQFLKVDSQSGKAQNWCCLEGYYKYDEVRRY